MKKTEIIGIIKDSLVDYFESIDESIELNEEIILFGRNSVLDSLGLVTLIIDIEGKLEDEFGVCIVLTNEKAMSQEYSPFRTVESLADFIVMLIEESNDE